MMLHHLSHIDLDGYGCQYLTYRCGRDGKFYNANYGAEIRARLDEIVLDIKESDFPDERPLILITDLNLSMRDAEWLDEQINFIDAELLLLDHHISGEVSASKFDWYMLDISKSATG